MKYIDVAPIEELQDSERILFEYEGKPVVLMLVAGEYFALQDCCTHDDGPLGDGDIEEYHIVCPRHGARFDVRTGKAVTLPAVMGVSTYSVRVVDGLIQVGFPDSE